MAYQIDSTCYDDLTSFTNAYAAKYNGYLFSNAGTLYRVVVSYASDGSVIYKVQNASTNATVTTQTMTAASPLCGKIDTADAITMSWAVVAAWVGAAVLIWMRRSLTR